MSHIELRNVVKNYELGKTKVQALRGINLSIEKSEMIGVVGPSGSGKSTLLNLIGCIDTATSGTVQIEGRDTAQMTDQEMTLLRRQKIGFIFQSFNLIPVLTAEENIELPLITFDISRNDRKKKVDEMLSLTGLEEFKKHRPDELSGGQRQRVAIARALVTKPSIVLADEPTANLDWENGNRILEAMKKLREQFSTIFIMATHDPRVLSFIDRKLFLEDGIINRIEES